MDGVIRLPVRETAEFLLQSGSIDNRYGGVDRGAEGAKIHRWLQKDGGADYKAEVALSLDIPFSGGVYRLEGRADGVYTENDLLTVDEIKTLGMPLEAVTEEFNAAHWGQACCYAHILAKTRNLDQVGVRLTYFSVDTGEIKRFVRVKSGAELEAFVSALLAEYEKWALFRREWSRVRDASIHALPFPFPEYRRGQREMAVGVYRTIQKGARLFCQAPTGIGKTVSALFPTIKAMGEGLCERIFYLTAKTITRLAAEEACTLMRRSGLRLKTVTLTAKDKICFLEERDCNPDACPYADGYYDRARDAVYDLLDGDDAFTRAAIETAARRRKVCPFELSLDLSLWCDCIVCDYNYLFDPVASLKRFFSDGKGEYVFLVDEAHNLVDRARDMYSAELRKGDILALKKGLGTKTGVLGRAVKELNDAFVSLRKDCEAADGVLSRPEPDKGLCTAAQALGKAASAWLEEHREPTALRQQVLETYFEVSFFLKILELYDGHYCTLDSAQWNETTTKLLCLDPSAALDERFGLGRSSIVFSATLSPLDYYREVLGGGADSRLLALPSPFAQERLCLLCAGRVSTKFRDRPGSLKPIAELLYRLVSGRRGNYLTYFPSYRYLLDVAAVFQEEYPRIETMVQSPNMDEGARERFLLRFDGGNEETLLGFCVLGGVFSEGVDLKGDRLIGVAVVGVGLPQIGPEPDLLRDYYDEKSGTGYEYAYQFPGMNKVQQAAGRVIRDGGDRGVVLLIDSRFPSGSYQRLFPPHWNHWRLVTGGEELNQQLEEFWGGGERGN